MSDGENPLALLHTAVGVQPVDATTARGRTFGRGVDRGGIFGGQMIAQALSAAAHTVPPEAVPDAIHVNLLGSGRSGTDVDFRIEPIRDGRALQHRDVRGYQEGKLVLQATVVSTVPGDGPDWQVPVLPPVGGPDTSGRSAPMWASGLAWGLFQVVHPADAGDPPASHPLWVRSTIEVPDDPWLRGAIVAFWSDFGLMWNARATHTRVSGPVSSTSASHSVWFHRVARPDGWHLFDVTTRSIAGNQAFVQASIVEAGGALVASAAQRVFLRRPQS